MLELSRPLAVAGRGRPLVFPSKVLPGALIDHRLNGENVPRFHEAYRLVASIVGHLGCAVENLSNTVTSIATNYGETLRFNYI